MPGFPARPTNPFPATTGGPGGGGGSGGGGSWGGAQFNQFNTQFNQFNTQINNILGMAAGQYRTIVGLLRSINAHNATISAGVFGQWSTQVDVRQELEKQTRLLAKIPGHIASANRHAGVLHGTFGRIGRLVRGMLDYRTLLTGVGMARAGKFVADQAMDLESLRYDLGRAMGSNPGSAGTRNLFSSMLFSAARMPGVDVGEYLRGGVMGARQGIGADDPSKLALFASDVGRMSAVFDDIPIDELTTQLSRLLGIFDLGSEKTANLASAVNKLDMVSTASARDILDVSVRMAGMATKMGMDAAQTTSLAAALRQAGLPRETAATSMVQIWGRMADRRFQPAFGRAAMAGASSQGIEGFDLDDFRRMMFGGRGGEGRDVLGATRLVAQGLQSMGPEDAMRALNRLSLDGQRVRGTILALGRVTEEWSDYLGEASREMGTASSLMESFRLKGETASAQIKQLSNNIRLAAAGFGEVLLPVIKGVNAGLGDLMMDWQEWTANNRGSLEDIGQAIGDNISYVGALVGNWKEVSALIGAYAQDYSTKAQSVLRRIQLVLDNMMRDLAHNLGVGAKFIGESIAHGIVNGFLGKGKGLFDRIEGVLGDGAAAASIKGILGPMGIGLDALSEAFGSMTEGIKTEAPEAPTFRWRPGRGIGGLGNLFENLPGNDKGIIDAQAELDEAMEGRRRRRAAQSGFVGLRERIARNGLVGGTVGDAFSGLAGTLGWAGRAMAAGEEERDPLPHERSSYWSRLRSGRQSREMRRQLNDQWRGRNREANAAWTGRYAEAGRAEREAIAARRKAESEPSKTIEGKADKVITILGTIAKALGGDAAAALVPRWQGGK